MPNEFTRRELMIGAAGAAALAELPRLALSWDEWARHDALGLAALVRAGEVTARELVDLCLARVDVVNHRLNAVVHRFDERHDQIGLGAVTDKNAELAAFKSAGPIFSDAECRR